MPELKRHAKFAEEDLVGRKHAVMSIPVIPTDKRDFEKIVRSGKALFCNGR